MPRAHVPRAAAIRPDHTLRARACRSSLPAKDFWPHAGSSPAATAAAAAHRWPLHLRPVHSAIVFNRIGGIKEEVYEEGTHFMLPWFERPIIFDVSHALCCRGQAAAGCGHVGQRASCSVRPTAAAGQGS